MLQHVKHITPQWFPHYSKRTTSQPLRASLERAGFKPVHVRDRIPYWNIARNDIVTLVTGDPKLQGRFGTILDTFKPFNLVTLRERIFHERDTSATARAAKQIKPAWLDSGKIQGLDSHGLYASVDPTVYKPRLFNVNNFRLVVDVDGEYHTVTRTRRANLAYDPRAKALRWDRFGLVHINGEPKWVGIPWPERDPDFQPDDYRGASPRIAAGHEAKAQTYEPAVAPRDNLHSLPEFAAGRINFGHGHHSRHAKRARASSRMLADDPAELRATLKAERDWLRQR